MVNLYAVDISKLPDPRVLPKVMESLSSQRKKRIAYCGQESARRQRLGAGLLLQQVFRMHGIESDVLQFEDGGKPIVDGLSFNLSHSGNLVLCAVGSQDVGCDVEKLREAPKKVGSRFFTEQEQDYLNTLDDEEYDRAFFQIWTMKESYVKMTGEGLRVPLSMLETDRGTPLGMIRNGEREVCHYKEYDIPGYQVVVCAKECEFANIQWFYF